MADFGAIQGSRIGGLVGGSTDYGVLLTASATAHTKGAWADLDTSTDFDADAIVIALQDISVAAKFLVDVAVTGTGGADGTLGIILSDLMLQGPAALSGGYHLLCPIPVPAGERLSARCQSNVVSATCRIGIYPIKTGFPGFPLFGRATTYGAETADSTGISIDPGATANTKGTWGVLSTSTANPIRALALILGNQANTAMTTADWRFNIGIGAAGVEQVLVEDLLTMVHTTGDDITPKAYGFPIPVSIPVASRLVVQSQCNITNATDRLLDAIIVGFD